MLSYRQTTDLVSPSLDVESTPRRGMDVRLHLLYRTLCRRYREQPGGYPQRRERGYQQVELNPGASCPRR